MATNKLVAKIADDVGKAAARSDQPPNALQVVPPGQEAAFLAPLSVEALWGVGPKTAERLQAAFFAEAAGDARRQPGRGAGGSLGAAVRSSSTSTPVQVWLSNEI